MESAKPSPFASALLFSYIANYIYDGDAPLAERRAQALSIDQSQLEEILGSTHFRELLDKAALDEVEAQLQWLELDYQAKHADGVHDLLLKLGDLTEQEVRLREHFAGDRVDTWMSWSRRGVRCGCGSAAKRDSLRWSMRPGIGMRWECRCRPDLRTPFWS